MLRTLVEIISSTLRVFLSGCKARFAGNSGTISKKRNAAAAAQEQPDAEIISTRVLRLALVLLLSCGAAAAHGAGATDAGAAARQAAAMTGGRVLDVQHGQSGDSPVYFVKVLLDDGRVKVVRVDGVPSQPKGR